MANNFDMNLFVVLHTLLDERSVTKTGQRLGRTQSAISNSLKRLREVFNDELFVRTPSGLVPTLRAEELAHNTRAIINLAEQSILPVEEFDPSQTQAQFVLGAPDRLSLPIFLPLLDRLHQSAPGIAIDLRTTDPEIAMQLVSDGSIDLAVGWFDILPQHLNRQHLYSEPLVCLCRENHPIFGLTQNNIIANVLAFSHLVISSGGGRRAVFDIILARRGLTRNAAATLSNFTMVPELLGKSDLVGVFTLRTANYLVDRYDLAIQPLPDDYEALADDAIWHRRNENSKIHIWFRSQIMDICV